LKTALDERRVVAYYQPIVDLASGAIAGFEALARLVQRDGTVLEPASFIAVAEESGLVLPLGAQVLEGACKQACLWPSAPLYDGGMSVAVNVSSRQLERGDLTAMVREVLAKTRLSPSRLHLELTETAIMDLNPEVLSQLSGIRELGVQIGLDDFGTGYASLTHLRRLPLDFVKVDRSFVQGLGSDPGDDRIVSAVIDLARNLGLRSIGEGAETTQQLNRLRELGCDQAQGYLFARPAPPQDLSFSGQPTDITERKRLDVRHRRTERMQSLGTLAGGLAHDLNNALSPVRMATELLQSQETDPSRLSMLDTVASGTQRATDMVRQILSFAAGAEGRRVAVDVGALLRDVERIANDTFLKTIRIVREDATDLLPVVGDPTQLNQVLINLCVNARDAMPQGGTLVLGAEVVDDPPGDGLPPGRYVCIRVEDDGQGMAPEILAHIFEPLYTTKEYGTGLGLSTSDGIITNHGGSISVKSKPGEGTRFALYLPVAAGTPSPAPAPEISTGPDGHGELILVVDDEDDIRTILRNVLTGSGYRVLEASDSAGALAVLSRAGSTVDLVVNDMTMPGMDGLETIRALRGVRPDVPIVVITGLPTQALSDEAAQLGIQHVLAKPFSNARLLQSLGDILNRA
jgi:EAL domain-containing protein (putative c-di-GMP-specific phosphodiesterase class I)/nitrogen-specific signal transduction histidine kinase